MGNKAIAFHGTSGVQIGWLAKGIEMKVFISQPMKGRTDKEILDERDAVIEYLKQKYSDISIIDSFLDIEPPEVKTISVFYLGKSIQLLSDADLCVVVGDVQ